MSVLLRKLLSRFLTLGAGEDPDDVSSPAPTDPSPPQGDAGAAADPADEGDYTDILGDDGESAGAAPADEDPRQALNAERSRREAAERELAELRNRSATPSRPAQTDPEFDREEAQLAEARRNGATDEQLRWLQWQITSNRTMRENTRTSQRALAEARDLSDRAEFNQLAATKPATFKRYNERIEKAIADLKAAGQVAPPRMALLRFMIGDDLMSGKVKPKATRQAAPAPAQPGTTSNVPRQRLPNVRTDVGARGNQQSDRDKRRARLENVPI